MNDGATKKRQPIKPTLFVIFAEQADVAVIFRRGPSDWYHVIRWDTRDDSFLHGAWFKGRIYPERCDLAPDGGLLLCFMHKGSNLRTSYTDSWNAISRCPWLHALWLMPQGTTYGGGGRFTGNQSVILRQPQGPGTIPHPDHPGHEISVELGSPPGFPPLHASSQEVEEADWSGRDRRGRLIYTSGGQLFVRAEPTGEERCIADFSECMPDPQPAPEIASAPLLPIRKARTKPF
jgi:hypothetical protein